MKYLEQYVHKVLHYTTKYNFKSRYSYAPNNLVGKYVRYPSYGDFPEAFFLRTYGKWWKNRISAQEEYRPQDFDLLDPQDFVILEFGISVIPREVMIYEVYNPGAVIRIWGRLDMEDMSVGRWILLWEGFPQKCAARSRKFAPQLRKTNNKINILKIEFNQTHLDYQTAIDGVLLCGCESESYLIDQLTCRGLADVKFSKSNGLLTVSDLDRTLGCDNYTPANYFQFLPNEIILKIFHCLDLKSLSRCAQVNRRWNKLAQDQTLYQNLSLKAYWYMVDARTLEYFNNRIKNIKKLDLSWCNENKSFSNNKTEKTYPLQLHNFLEKASGTLTHLSMNDNYSVTDSVLKKVALCKDLTDLRLHHTMGWWISPLGQLTKLVSLDLSMTRIRDHELIDILIANPNLEHLIIDLCETLQAIDSIAETASIYNKKLKTWSSWKTSSFTNEGVRHFRALNNLEDLDLGWCLMNSVPEECLSEISDGCKLLKRLILSEWRGVSDQLLRPIILSCKELTQLDLMGIRNITEDICERALLMLPKLRLLDISFCDRIRPSEVAIWRQQFPHITIQRSCEYTSAD